MNSSQAQNAIVTSATLVGAIYVYRRLVDEDAGNKADNAPTNPKDAVRQLVGVGPVAPTGRFITGWGFTYLTLAAVEGPAPELAGPLAWLVLAGCLLGNGRELARTIQQQLRGGRDEIDLERFMNYGGAASAVQEPIIAPPVAPPLATTI